MPEVPAGFVVFASRTLDWNAMDLAVHDWQSLEFETEIEDGFAEFLPCLDRIQTGRRACSSQNEPPTPIRIGSIVAYIKQNYRE
jgi:hypothetical protein